MTAELRNLFPPAPEILKAGVLHETSKAQESDFRDAFEHLDATISPMMKALTDLEVYSRSTTLQNGVPQKDLWRRTLMTAPSFLVDEENFCIGVTQIVNANNVTTNINFWTNVGYDTQTIVYAMAQMEERFPYPRVRTKRDWADKSELEAIKIMADLVASETPRQMMANGAISPSWMERQSAMPEDPTFSGKYSEGVPNPENGYPGKPQIYELILHQGNRIVAHVDDNGKTWTEDAKGIITVKEDEVAAWRKLYGVILPEYYKSAKYPSLPKQPMPANL